MHKQHWHLCTRIDTYQKRVTQQSINQSMYFTTTEILNMYFFSFIYFYIYFYLFILITCVLFSL